MSRKVLEDFRRRAVPSPVQQRCADYVRKVAARFRVGVPYQLEVIGQLPDVDQPFALPGNILVVPVSTLTNAQDAVGFELKFAHALGHLAHGHGIVRKEAVIPTWAPPHSGALYPLTLQPLLKQWEEDADHFAFQLLVTSSKSGRDETEFLKLRKLVRGPRTAPTLRKDRKSN